MEKEPYRHFLFFETEEKQQRPNPTKKCPSQFETICNYNSEPFQDPLDVDNYEFKFKGGFLTKLSKLYDKIKSEGEKFTIPNTSEENPKLFIRDVLTEYTVKNIFEIDTQNDLIHLINRIITSMYDQFYQETKIRLYFVYRGGNILKMYKKSFESILPGKSRKIFKEEFDPFFKNSDLDFYTVIQGSEKLSSFEIYSINSYIQMMCYYGCYIARIFIMNNYNLFDFCKINQLQLNEDFKSILEALNLEKLESELKDVQKANFIGLGFSNFIYMNEKFNVDKILKLPKSKLIEEFVPNKGDSELNILDNYKKNRNSGRSDLNISVNENNENESLINKISYKKPNLFKYDYQKMVEELAAKNKLLPFYITNNNDISSKEEYIDFSLVRLMMNFVVVYKRGEKFGFTNAPSELYDLSIGHPEDKMYQVYTSNNIVPYEFTYKDDKKDTIYIPAIETTILDLIFILFEYRDFPWEDPKYKKRLYRLMILIFVLEMSQKGVDEMEKILNSNEKRKYKDDFDNKFDTLRFRNDEVKEKLETVKDQKNFKEYLILYHEIISKLKNVLQKVKKFSDIEKKTDKKEIYEFNM
jgi:hypothetical protein